MTFRRFDLGDVLSVTTGKLVSRRHVAGIYDILGYLTGEAPYTHQLGRFMDECRPHLLRQHPALAAVTGSEVTTKNWQEWLAHQETMFGSTLEVRPIPKDDHAHRDPIQEAVDMVGAERVIVVDPEQLA